MGSGMEAWARMPWTISVLFASWANHLSWQTLCIAGAMSSVRPKLRDSLQNCRSMLLVRPCLSVTAGKLQWGSTFRAYALLLYSTLESAGTCAKVYGSISAAAFQ